jgi:hypothetical protein
MQEQNQRLDDAVMRELIADPPPKREMPYSIASAMSEHERNPVTIWNGADRTDAFWNKYGDAILGEEQPSATDILNQAAESGRPFRDAVEDRLIVYRRRIRDSKTRRFRPLDIYDGISDDDRKVLASTRVDLTTWRIKGVLLSHAWWQAFSRIKGEKWSRWTDERVRLHADHLLGQATVPYAVDELMTLRGRGRPRKDASETEAEKRDAAAWLVYRLIDQEGIPQTAIARCFGLNDGRITELKRRGRQLEDEKTENDV